MNKTVEKNTFKILKCQNDKNLYIIHTQVKYVPFECKYLSFNVIKYIKLEKLTKLNKNTRLHLFLSYFKWFLHEIRCKNAFYMLENKTIISEINYSLISVLLKPVCKLFTSCIM